MISKTIISTVLAGAIGFAGMVPAASAPLRASAVQTPESSLVVNVDQQRGFHRRNGEAYMNGHRGSRHRRHGYREYNGWWFPPAAFALGFFLGQAAQPQYRPAPRHQLSRAHYRWCDARYRSYRYYDNTFQPYHGPRRQCVSPYY